MNELHEAIGNWTEVSLGNICRFEYGKSLPAKTRTGSGSPVFGSNGIVGLHKDSLTKGETIIVGRKGSYGEVHHSFVPCSPIDTTYYITKDQTDCDLRWLFYRLKNLGLNRLNRAAAVPGLNREDAYRQPLKLPPLPEQKRIAQILDAADALRAKRRESIAQLDALVQSTFLEMFGDPQLNPFKFPIGELNSFYINKREGTKCGPFGSALKKSEIVEEGIPVWNMDNISVSSQMSMPFRMWISEEKYNDLIGYSVINGDILISRAGTVGKMCVVNLDGNAGIISTNLIRLRLGHDLLPEYFVALMTYCKGRVGRLRTGPDGAFTHMNTGVLDNLIFPVPPLEIQHRFLSIQKAIEKQKSQHTTHLTELNTLFASLQSQAFNGEL